jgi:hypothetical protein
VVQNREGKRREGRVSFGRRARLLKHIGIAALLLMPVTAGAQDAIAPPQPTAGVVPAQAAAEYRRRLRDYTLAWQSFDSEASDYWSAIVEKRRARLAKRRNGQAVSLDDYVLTQPPVYDGPPRPIDPAAPDRPPPVGRDTKYVPTIPEMLAAAGKRDRVQARLCKGGRSGRRGTGAGRAPLRFRDRRHRHLRRAVGPVERAARRKAVVGGGRL